jgi:hypothetical protein
MGDEVTFGANAIDQRAGTSCAANRLRKRDRQAEGREIGRDPGGYRDDADGVSDGIFVVESLLTVSSGWMG